MGEMSDVEELKEVLTTVSELVPALIKGIIGSVFSAEAGRNMGAAAANFYKELRAGGIPNDVAVKMTEDYVKTFTSLGELIREAMSRKGVRSEAGHEREMGEEVSKAVREAIKKKIAGEQREEQDD